MRLRLQCGGVAAVNIKGSLGKAKPFRSSAGRARRRPDLGPSPRKALEVVFWTIGRTLGVTCFVSGWFMPMYFAGRLESRNSVEYEDAAVFAKELEMHECVDDLLAMARIEVEHEVFFREMVTGHRLLPAMKKVFRWS
jgi:hypothetical protein